MENRFCRVSKVQELETMSVFALASLLLGVKSQRQAFVYLAIGFLLIALLAPPLARVITLGWMKLSLLLAKVNNRIILTIMFYLILVPLACLYRVFHKDPLLLAKKESGSYYCDRNHTYTKADLEKMW